MGNAGHHHDSIDAAVLDSLPVEILVHDPQRLVYANNAALRVFEAADRTELVGQPITRVVHPDGISAGNQRRTLLFKQGQCFPRVGVKLLTLTGKTFYADGMARRLSVGDDDLALVMQSKFGGTGLPKNGGFVSSHAAYPHGTPLEQAILDALPMPVVVHDATHIVYVNEAAAYAFRADSSDSLVGMPMCDLLHPDGRDASVERRRLLFEMGYAFSGVNAKTRACDGTVMYATTSGGVVDTKDGKRIGYCSIQALGTQPGRTASLG